MDDRYRTIFNNNSSENKSRSLPRIGKESDGKSLRFASGSQSNIFQPINNSDALKFFEGEDNSKTDRYANPPATERLRSEKVPASLPSGRGLYTDPLASSKAAYSNVLQQQVQEKTLRQRKDIEHNREADFQMLKERHENDPFGKQGSGAPILDEFGRVNTTRKKPGFQNFNPYQQLLPPLDSGRYSSLSNTINPDNIDPDKVHIKPHNPYINRIGTSHTILPEFAMKAQLLKDSNLKSLAEYLNQNHPPQRNQPTYLAQMQYLPSSMLANNMTQVPNQENMIINSGSSPGLTSRAYVPEIQETARIQANTLNEEFEKTRKLQSTVELQKDLLAQIEDKKRRDEEERRKKKLQDILDDERIRRENEEFMRLYGTKFEKLEPRNLNLSFASQKERDKSRINFYSSQDVLRVSPGKPATRRPRTPIDEIERRMRLEELNRSRINVSLESVRELPSEVNKQIAKTIADELKNMRIGFIGEQQRLNNELLNLRQQALTSNKERILTQKELDEFKTKFREQQLREEIRQGELYRALVNNSHPPVIYSSTMFNTGWESDLYSLRTQPGYEGFWKKLHDQDFDPDNVKVKTRSDLISIPKRGRVLDPDFNSDYGYSSAQESLNYLKYFDETNNGMGIKMADKSRKYGLPDDPDNMNNLLSLPVGEDEMATDAVRLLRKNNNRLVLLDQMENTDVEKLDKLLRGRNEFKEEAKRPISEFVDDAGMQEFKSNLSYADSLVDQLNHPRAFLSIDSDVQTIY